MPTATAPAGARPIVEAGPGNLTPSTNDSRLLWVRIIDAGTGSSGKYPPETLEAAADARIFHEGLHFYYDHPTAEEDDQRPERSVLTLAGSLAGDAQWFPEHQALEAPFRPLASHADAIVELAELIGLSIRASAEIDDEGTVTRLVEAHSVDLVTHAGRGGRILDVLESTRQQIIERNGGQLAGARHGRQATAEEATNNDLRRYLADAVETAYETDGTIVFLEDFDETYAYVRRIHLDGDTRRVDEFRQAYDRDGVNVTLTGPTQPVKAETVFTPTTPEPDPTPAEESATPSASTATAGGTPMVDINESELTQLRATAEQAESERARADQAEQALAEARAERTCAQATQIVEAEFAGIDAPKAKARLVETATAAEAFDAETFRTEAQEAAAEFNQAPAGPRVTGFGDTNAPAVSESAQGEDLSDEILSTLQEAR